MTDSHSPPGLADAVWIDWRRRMAAADGLWESYLRERAGPVLDGDFTVVGERVCLPAPRRGGPE